MEDLKEKIIYLQDELITCLRKISRLEDDNRTIEYLKDNTIESLKREIEKIKVEKMKLEYHKCENKEYPCNDAATYPCKRPVIDFTTSTDGTTFKQLEEKLNEPIKSEENKITSTNNVNYKMEDIGELNNLKF